MKRDSEEVLERLSKAVRGGRVMSTEFLEPEEAAELYGMLLDRDIDATLDGGFPGAKRRVLSVFPEHMSSASVSLAAVLVPDLQLDDLKVKLRLLDIPEGVVGDIVSLPEGAVIVLMASEKDKAKRLRSAQDFNLSQLAKGKFKELNAIVASLRVDALGAKAFNVSRSYFGKGIASKKVSINGKVADKASDVELNDEIYAEGLGRFWVRELQGNTKKGNHKVRLDIELHHSR
ncbi:MAG: hypothetical protein R2880_08935 [Deinococcales bacterium]